MRDGRKNQFASNMLVSLKDQSWLDRQREAGRIAANALLMCQGFVERIAQGESKMTLLQLNAMVENFILLEKGIPTFKGYKGFPSGVCISVNKQLVHGIPTDYELQQGDVVSFDLGVTIDGAIADTAITCICGQPKSEQHAKLVAATELALMKGIEAIKVGNRLGCIGEAIYKSARGNNFSVVNNYGGHGLDWNTPHASPFVENKSDSNKGIRIQRGLAIAIEPMLVIGSSVATTTGTDGWTVSTPEIGAHFEHSIFVHEDRVEIITDRGSVR